MRDIAARVRQTALEILIQEGIDGLSMRKLASRMGCSTGVLYHHYPDKEAILSAIAQEGYREILDKMRSVPFDPGNPVEGVQNAFDLYVREMLANRAYAYIALMSPIAPILKKAVVLQRGISLRSETFRMLAARLQEGMDKGLIRPGEPELTAQLVWTTSYGLLARLILEKETPEDQQERLLGELRTVLGRILTP